MLLCRTAPTGYGLDFRRLLTETPLDVFEQWRVLYGLEPWGEERSDLAAGIAVMHNVAAHGTDPKAPADYMPYLQRAENRRQRPQSQAAMKDTFAAICKMMDRRSDL